MAEILHEALGVRLWQEGKMFLCEKDGEVLTEGENPLEVCSSFCSSLEGEMRRSFRAYCEEHGRSRYTGEIDMKFSELKDQYPEYYRLIDRADRLIMSGEKTAAELIEAADGWIGKKIAPEHQAAARSKFITFCSLRAQAKAREEEEKKPNPSLFDRGIRHDAV